MKTRFITRRQVQKLVLLHEMIAVRDKTRVKNESKEELAIKIIILIIIIMTVSILMMDPMSISGA